MQVYELQQRVGILQRANDFEIMQLPAGPQREEAAKEVFNALHEAKSQLASAEGIGTTKAQFQVMRDVGTQRAEWIAQEAGIVGHTPLEQMLNRGRGIARSISDLEHIPSGSRSQIQTAQLAELYQQRHANQVEEAHRTEELPFLIEQNRREAQRTFARETLFAGPQELLARIGMMRAAQRGVGPGEFMSFSPENRRLFDELHGGEAGARLREEQRLAHGTGMTPDRQARSQVSAAAASAAQLAHLGTQAAGAAVALELLKGAVKGLADMLPFAVGKGESKIAPAQVNPQGGGQRLGLTPGGGGFGYGGHNVTTNNLFESNEVGLPLVSAGAGSNW
jgi:hypothetical protein